jgi:hypothetical protein
VSIATKLKSFNRIQLASIAFYAVSGILLLALLPFTGFPPHMGFLGIVSLITAYSLFTKRAWAPWLVFIMLVTITVFSGVTLYSVGFSNLLVTALILPYLVLAWVFTVFLLRRKD